MGQSSSIVPFVTHVWFGGNIRSTADGAAVRITRFDVCRIVCRSPPSRHCRSGQDQAPVSAPDAEAICHGGEWSVSTSPI